MVRLEQVSTDDLRKYLEAVEEKRPTLRLIVGINYKEGVPQSVIADWYGISRTTVHNWLARLERLPDEPAGEVLYDTERPGRPSKLAGEQWNELVSILEDSPSEAGIDIPRWSPRPVQKLIREKFDVEYSLRHVRELLNRAGISWNQPVRSSQTADELEWSSEQEIKN